MKKRTRLVNTLDGSRLYDVQRLAQNSAITQVFQQVFSIYSKVR
jgi:hypothetical protein